MAAKNRSFWVLLDPASFLNAVRQVAAVVPDARILIASPCMIVEGDDATIATVSGIPGVRAVTPVVPEIGGVVEGLDTAVQLCVGVLDGVAGDSAEGADVGGAVAYPQVWGGVAGGRVPPVVWAAVNMSISPSREQFQPTLASDAVNFLTGYAAGFLVPVVAAGNHHDLTADLETVSPWAEPPWVIGVGATLDAALTEEAPWSARATPGGPDVGPDVLAWGSNLFKAGDAGTSFAAARVTRMIGLIRAFLFQIAADVDRRDGRPFGVPLIGVVILDRGFDRAAFPRVDWPALPVLSLTDDAWVGIEDITRRALGDTLAGPRGPALSRELLLAAARSATPAGSRLSAPAISVEGLVAFLAAMTATGLLRLAGGRAGSDVVAAGGAPGVPLFRPGDVERLRLLHDSAAPAWRFDIDQRRGHPRPRTPME